MLGALAAEANGCLNRLNMLGALAAEANGFLIRLSLLHQI
jgi:hypothetical protein